MGSRDGSVPHQPLLSSLVVRPSDSGGGGGSDYEPGEVRRDAPPYSRSSDPALFVAWCKNVDLEDGYRRTASVSPVRRRDLERGYSPPFDRLDGPPRHRGFGGGRENMRSPGRYRDFSPPHSRGRGRGGRPFGRGFDGPGYGPGAVRGEGMHKKIPNVRPREGDWYCSDPGCGNLNFARREVCNNCKRPRYPHGGSPRRGFGGPPPLMGPPRRFSGHPMDRSPGRFGNGYRSSPPRSWQRDGPRDFGHGGPPPRHEGRFPDHHQRRDRLDYSDEDFRDRGRFDRPPPAEWGPREHGRDGFMDRKGYERRPLSPLAPSSPPRGRWADREVRERSRSPMRVGPPLREFRREPYVERGRDERRGVGRDRIGNVY